ncbi:heterokaryon incompatibility protein-domain-containing protein [Diplogelasinospora grovesii]|uniref:Heterokaryon incompatibility protein-domain-containing protein n=1 Tax=Diplogelasinospora grovesii TaxID=303347 RepID=A0AAN6RYX1_9PEZI|nr:heterokaryon incompatibility protein-domain-containing protein [Diplogelasinospora grovesii]
MEGNGFRSPRLDGGLQLTSIFINTIPTSGQLALFAKKDSPAATSGDAFGIGPLADSSSEEALSVLRGWLEECATNHKCGAANGLSGEDDTAEPELPTRILEISAEAESSSMRLVETGGKRGRYAALSHCWGPPDKQPLRTTKATLQQHLAGIPVPGLPKTFRDAVTITRAVGLRYIWIDSLCIVQDDRDDWSSEAPRMAQVYGTAYLVIAASGARNSTEGCFIPRIPPGSSFAIPYPAGDGEQSGQVLLSKPKDITLTDPVFQPLGRRAWGLQEWLLARRIVHYTAGGMLWSCKQLENSTMCEEGIQSDVGQGSLSDWDKIIGLYTIRSLTHLPDKLIAVQSLAEEMQKSRTDRYCNGLWTSDLPQQLFWIGPDITRPKELEGFPSWSWASTDGRCVPWSTINQIVPWESIHRALTIEEDNRLVVSCNARRCIAKKWKPLVHDTVRQPPFSKPFAPVSVMDSLPVHFYMRMVHSILDESTGEVVGLAMLDEADGPDHSDLHERVSYKRCPTGRPSSQPHLLFPSLTRKCPVSGAIQTLGCWVRGG